MGGRVKPTGGLGLILALRKVSWLRALGHLSGELEGAESSALRGRRVTLAPSSRGGFEAVTN